MRRDRALALLAECTGNDIWSPDHCEQAGVPREWVEELSEAYESGFDTDRETIYYQDRVTNQYFGVRDVYLAIRLGQELGIDVEQATAMAVLPVDVVMAIKDAVAEG